MGRPERAAWLPASGEDDLVRVGLAPEGTRGDVYPLLALGDWLRTEGHQVCVCAPPDFQAAVTARGFEHRPVGRDVHEELARRAEAIVRGGWRMARAGDRFLRAAVAEQFRDLGAALRGCDHVVGAGVQLAAPSVAEHLGLSYRYAIYCPQVIPSGAHPPFTVERQHASPRVNRLLWRLSLGILDRRFGRILDRERAALGLAPVSDLYRYMGTARPLLAADPVLADAPSDAELPVDVIGALQPERVEPLPGKVEHFLQAGPRPVYLGFGSMTDPRPDATTRLVLDAVERAGCRAVVSRGWAGLGDGPLPEGVLAVDGVDHAALFPRMAAVVHHGGAGTTTSAARAGVPQLVVPHVLDQYWWARRVHALGVAAPPIPRRRLDAARLAATLRALLESELVAERARELARRLLATRPPRATWRRALEPL